MPTIGEKVIIKGDKKNRGKWKVGMVEEIFPSRDGAAREVKVRVGKSHLERVIWTQIRGVCRGFPSTCAKTCTAVTCHHMTQMRDITARLISMRSSRMNFRWLAWPITARVHCHANEALSVVKVGQRRASGALFC